MNELNIEYININEIKPYKNNPKKNDKAVEKVVASIKEFGFKNPIIIDKNMEIITGHTRFKAAIKLKMDKVPIIRAEDLTEEQVKAYRIADNKTGEIAEWDTDLLLEEINKLKLNNYDIESTGFDEKDIKELIDQTNKPIDIDELLTELDTKTSIEKPIWVTIRTSVDNQELLEKALIILENNGIRMERSYET